MFVKVVEVIEGCEIIFFFGKERNLSAWIEVFFALAFVLFLDL